MHLALPQPCKHPILAVRGRSRGIRVRRINTLRAQAPDHVEGEVLPPVEEEEGADFEGGVLDLDSNEYLEDGESSEVPQMDDSRVPDLQIVIPGDWQQTLWRSFCVGGVGLHSGELSCVRVRPALAGEGRYFVRVPPGTNAGIFAARQEKEEEEAEEVEVYPNPSTELDEEKEDDMAVTFLDYMRKRDSGTFQGTFSDYARETFEGVASEGHLPPEPIKPRSEEEDNIIANIDNVNTSDHPYCTTLGEGEKRVQSVEHLLSALEACGIDNARIEIEGGPEVPVLDGSAFGWVREVSGVGVAEAFCMIDGEQERVQRAALEIDQVISVQDGSRSMTFIPEDNMRISYGLDSEAPAIGKQWHTWCLQDLSEDYATTVAPAKSFVSSLDELYSMRDEGYVKGGVEGVLLVPEGSEWVQEDLMHFPNEAARHKIVDLIGDMSLLSLGGMSGLPYGHIIAHNADHALHLKFIRALKDFVGEEYYSCYKSDPRAPE